MIWALSHLIILVNCTNDSEKKMIFKALIKSQFSYYPVVLMFCSRQTNNMINKIHKKALRIVLNDHISDFEIMLRNIGKTSKYSDYCHCMKSVQIRNYFWSVFSCIRTEYGDLVNLRIQSECRKIQTRNNSIFGYFSRSVWLNSSK